MKCFLLVLSSAISLAAPLEVDYFTRKDAASLGPRWVQNSNLFDIFGNSLRSVGGSLSNHMAEWTGTSAPANDQCSCGTTDYWDDRSNQASGGVAIRMDAATVSGYGCSIVAGNSGNRRLKISRFDAGVETVITDGATSQPSIPAGYILRGWVVGTTIHCLLTTSVGTTILTEITGTDSTYSSGRVGFNRANSASGISWSQWWGGDGDCSNRYVTPTVAGEFYASSTATNHIAAGSLSDPWPFLDFFSDQTRLPCGSKLWFRGGTYTHDLTIYNELVYYLFTQSCTSTTAITYAQFPGETTLFDPNITCETAGVNGYNVFRVSGNYSILDGGYLGWHFLNSNGACKVITRCGSNPTPTPIRAAYISGNYVKLRNIVVHDLGDGIADNGSNAEGTETTGVLVFNIGWNAPDRGHGHGGYMHNTAYLTVRKTVRNSIFLRNQEYGIKLFSQSGASVGNFLIDSTVLVGGRYDGATPRSVITGTTFLVQGGEPENIELNKLYVYGNDLRFNGDSAYAPGFRLTNSIIDGGFVLTVPSAAVVTNNVFSRFGVNTSAYYAAYYAAAISDAFTPIDNNAYYSVRSTNDWLMNSNLKTWTTYRALDPGVIDASSTFSDTIFPASGGSPGASSTNYINVLPSPIQPGTGSVVVYNWKGSSSVLADVSTIISVGDPYEVIDAQCLSCGPVATGIYAGGNLSFDMTLTAIQAPPSGYDASPGSTCTAGSVGGSTPSAHPDTLYVHTETYFGVFIVRRRQIYRTVQLSTVNPFDAATQLKVESGPSATVLNFPAQTVACATAALCKFAISTQMTGNTFYKLTYLTAGNATVSQSDAIRIGVN